MSKREHELTALLRGIAALRGERRALRGQVAAWRSQIKGNPPIVGSREERRGIGKLIHQHELRLRDLAFEIENQDRQIYTLYQIDYERLPQQPGDQGPTAEG